MASFRSERSLGFIDAIYAIAATLLALEFPEDIVPLFIKGEFLSYQLFEFTLLYFSSFYLLYDLWIIHKTSAMNAREDTPRIYDFLSASLMATVVLAPGLIQAAFESFADAVHQEWGEILAFRIMFLFYFLLIYVIVFFIETISVDKDKRTRRFGVSLYAVSLLFVSAVLSCVLIRYGWTVPLPLIAALILGARALNKTIAHA